MIKNKMIFKLVFGWVSMLGILIFSPLGFAQESVTVRVTAMRSAGNIQYSYQVSNHTSARNIVSLSIGNRGDQPELTIYPLGSYWGQPSGVGDQRYMEPRLGGVFTSPLDWNAKIMLYEEKSNFSVDWNLDENITSNFPVIYPGQTFNFGVTVPTDSEESDYIMNDPAYVTGHFTVGFDYSAATDEGPAFWDYTGTIVPIDTTPPVLTVSLSPDTLWPPNGKLVPITATITVKDDYDPSPEIHPESITANEPFDEDEDIQDIDDQHFGLAAKRLGTNQAGRIYTVTYSATDASGNKATASATVTVPHDQRK